MAASRCRIVAGAPGRATLNAATVGPVRLQRGVVGGGAPIEKQRRHDWPVLMGYVDAAAELGVMGELPLKAGHADGYRSDVVAVEEVAELLEQRAEVVFAIGADPT